MTFLREQLRLHPSLVSPEDLKAAAVVLTNHGPLRPSEHSIHFTPAYGCDLDLAKYLPGMSSKKITTY